MESNYFPPPAKMPALKPKPHNRERKDLKTAPLRKPQPLGKSKTDWESPTASFTHGQEEERELSVRGLVPPSGIWKWLELHGPAARSQPLRKMLPLPLLPASPGRSEGPPRPARAACSAPRPSGSASGPRRTYRARRLPSPRSAPPGAQTPPAAETTWAQPREGPYFAHIQKPAQGRGPTLDSPSSRHGFPHRGLGHCRSRARAQTHNTHTHAQTHIHRFLCQDQCCHCKPGKRLQGDQVPALCELLSCSLHPPLTRKPNRTSFFFSPEKPSTAII